MNEQNSAVQPLLTGDEIRAAVRQAHSMTAPSDTTEPGDYVMAGVRALLSKLRAPVADETQALHDHDLWFQEYGQTLGAFYNNLTIHTRAAWVAASRQYAALAGAPVAEPETMEEIHRRERERAPWVLPKDPTLPASAPDTSEADASPIVPGGPYSDPEQFIASLGASAPVAGYIKPDPAAPTHPRYVSELKYRSAADAEADPEGKGWLKVYTAPQASPVAGEAQPVACLRRQSDGSDWGHWKPASVEDGQRVTGLRSWQVRWLVDAAPQASAEPVRIVFPAHLRKMWSGGEVQAWLDEHQGITAPKPSAKGSLERYRQWQAAKDSGQRRAGDDFDIEAAAKTMAECMDYPWAHMPEKGREQMRLHAQSVIRAALSATQADTDKKEM
ncbi:hypothetical protein [Bordetella hinzii]|uniref:hypothetical protein n=1 Tax=Bordetella hinzii TaxID=103855 RepID=UPI00114FF489|nr:hypothetical protein [Bordetella hinzii]QDJ45013.1 hypothetical protein CBR71_03915 [Bordetella hinzii]